MKIDWEEVHEYALNAGLAVVAVIAFVAVMLFVLLLNHDYYKWLTSW